MNEPASPSSPPPFPDGFPPSSGTLDRSLEIVRFLRIHCPWDERQTARSLVPHLLEEVHETVEAIHADDPAALLDELGDLLLNVAFQVVLADEAGHFTDADVIRHLEEKMVRRHPKLFGGPRDGSWDDVKAAERSTVPAPSGPPEDAAGLDALLRAHRVQRKASAVGFDWEDVSGALAKLREEIGEVESAIASGDDGAIEDEIGDLLFSVVNVARLAGAHSSVALARATGKFERRFGAVKAAALSAGLSLPGASLEELDALWDAVKRDETLP